MEELQTIRNSKGITLPFALLLTFIFSSLVGVSYLFVSVNLRQMQSSLYTLQAIALSEGVNEKIKARLNSKVKIQPSPKQEKKLKSQEEQLYEESNEDTGEFDEETFAEEEFNEETEDFEEYYADEILKFSRYITFREPPEKPKLTEEETDVPTQEDQSQMPEANVDMIGSIPIPRGTVLKKGFKMILYKGEKVGLRLKDITTDQKQGFRQKLPAPIIKALTPNYGEINTRCSFVASGENLQNTNPHFTNKDIQIENVKAGPYIEFLIGMDMMPGLARFYLDSAQGEFYIIPVYDGSQRPLIDGIKDSRGDEFFESKVNERKIVLMIYGNNLYLGKSTPVVIPDVCGIIPHVKDQSSNGKEITVSLDITKKVEPGVHSLVVASEGGLSNSWPFNVLPADREEDLSANTGTVSSVLTLLEIRVVENLLPLIDEKEAMENATNEKSNKEKKKSDKKGKDDTEATDNLDDEEMTDEEEPTESKKLSPFANTDLETVWLIETTAMVGKITKTISEVIHREIPNIHAGLTTNGEVTFSGGSYLINGATNAMTRLIEPTYLSNIILKVEGPPEEPLVPIIMDETGRAKEGQNVPKSPTELGFRPGSLLTVYKEGDRISELDYAAISKVGRDTIELELPGLMDFHYEGDPVFQFIPPVISSKKIEGEEAEKHLTPKDYAVSISNAAKFRNIFKSNLDQYSEVADLYTNDTEVPKDEYDLPLGFMGLSYIDATPVFDRDNALSGKGILIVDTRSDNLGRAGGTVEITGDSRSPADFSGVVYIHGNLKISGNVNIDGALIVDNDKSGSIEIDSAATGMISFNERAIKQTLLSIPFTTKPGTVMISNKSIDLTDATDINIKTRKRSKQLGLEEQQVGKNTSGGKTSNVKIIETKPQGSAEQELIKLF